MYGFLFGGPQTSAGQVASVAGSFFGVFLFCGSQSARQMNQGRNRKRWFSFGAAESITLRKKKHTPAPPPPPTCTMSVFSLLHVGSTSKHLALPGWMPLSGSPWLHIALRYSSGLYQPQRHFPPYLQYISVDEFNQTLCRCGNVLY